MRKHPGVASRAGEESRGESGLSARHRLSRLPAIRGSASVLASRTAQPSGCDTRNHRSKKPNASSQAYSERWFLGRFGAFSFFLSLLKKKRKRRQSPLCRRNDACMRFGKCPTRRSRWKEFRALPSRREPSRREPSRWEPCGPGCSGLRFAPVFQTGVLQPGVRQ